MNPYNSPTAEIFFNQLAKEIISGVDNPQELLRKFPKLVEKSIAMARSLKSNNEYLKE